jgi:hypothetical protein
MRIAMKKSICISTIIAGLMLAITGALAGGIKSIKDTDAEFVSNSSNKAPCYEIRCEGSRPDVTACQYNNRWHRKPFGAIKDEDNSSTHLGREYNGLGSRDFAERWCGR